MLKPKSKVSSKYHWNQMWVRLRDDSPPWKFPLQLWTCETRQVKCFLNTVMGQAYNRHSHSKCEKQERKKRWWTTSKPKSAQGKCHQILMLKNNPLWFDALPFRLNGAAALPSGPTTVGAALHSWLPLAGTVLPGGVAKWPLPGLLEPTWPLPFWNWRGGSDDL